MANVKMIYGEEFWSFLTEAIKHAKHHIFIFTAFTKDDDLNDIIGKINHLPHLIVVRDQQNLRRNLLGNVIPTDYKKFHAKVYVIDDMVIVGSQNLYKVSTIPLSEKKGEISVAFKPYNTINIIYQALMIVLQGEYEEYYSNKMNELEESYGYEYNIGWVDFFKEYKLESFLNLNSRICPCCSGNLLFTERKEALLECSSNTYGKIEQSECGTGNACKYCVEGPILLEPEITYSCPICSFRTGYQIHNLNKRPYWSWEILSAVTVPYELQNFLKLYFYLIDKLSESRANSLLTSLGILGRLSKLSLTQRDYGVFNFDDL